MKFHIVFVIVSVALISFASDNVFAQSSVDTSPQTTLSGDLLNDPIAQDILNKIELTKQWIAELEQREYEKTQAQQFLDERRAIALEHLAQDLKEWETLWANYTSRASFERFVDNKPSHVQGVFWDAFEFKEMKVKAGRDALKEVKANGGSLKEAREAYIKAAETKRIELIEQNNQFNVKHNLAYYQQQLLFDIQGQLVQTTESQEKLNEYYTDYRTDPAYLLANPDDKYAYDSVGETNADTQCRDGYVVIHRFQASDYACVTESTAEMWIRHGIGEIPGIAEIFQEAELENKDNIGYQIDDINKKINEMNTELQAQQIELKDLYDQKYQNVDILARAAEKQIINEYTSNSNMTKQELTQKLLMIRSQVGPEKDKILDEKLRALEELKIDYENKMLDVLEEYQGNLDIQITWNPDITGFELEIK